MSQTPPSRGLSEAGRDPAVVRAFLVMLRATRPDSGATPEGIDRVLGGAREFSQRLGLPGLATLLAALRRGLTLEPDDEAVGEAWQALREALAACEEKGDLSPLLEADADHEALGRHLEVVATRPASSAARRGERVPARPHPITLDEALDGLRVHWPRHSTIVARQLELGEKTAAALRAAIEWLLGDSPAQWPLEVSADDTVIEVSLPRVEAQGVDAAGKALAACAAALVPPGPGGTAWKARVPWRTEAPSFLLVRMGELSVAFPWASVLRMSMLTAAGRDALARRTGWPPLDDVTGYRMTPDGESPVVPIGLGLRRGLVAASRLVWRMPCSPDPGAGPPPAPWLKRGLLTPDGERFWEADVEVLLQSPQAEGSAGWWRPMVRPAPRTAAPPAPGKRPDAPIGSSPITPPGGPTGTKPSPSKPLAPAQGGSTPPSPPAPPTRPAAPREQTTPPGPVPTVPTAPPPGPVGAPAVPVAPLPPVEATTYQVPPARLDLPPAPAQAPRAVLIAEDSLTASMFLSRLLETEGARCQTVDTLADLRAALTERRWDLVCVDVDLPDAPAGEALEVARAHGAPVVALVRDSFDEGMAVRASVTAFLRKPFDPRVVHEMLHSLRGPETAP